MRYLFLIPLFLGVSQFSCSNSTPDKPVWEQLFNGKDLSGWDIKIAGHELSDNYKNTFKVEDGLLKVNYNEYEHFDNKFGHIYYYKPFSYYIIRTEYRFVGEQLKGGVHWNVRNSGVMLHSQAANTLTKDQPFPISIELQLLGGLGEERPTGNVCTPGTQVEMNGKLLPDHCINSSSKTYNGDQWVTAEAIVLGDSIIHHLINGDTVLTYNRPQIGALPWIKKQLPEQYDYWAERNGELLREGYLALQAESHAIHFRKVELLNLEGCMDKKAVNYKSYYIKPKPSACLY
ncbi:DUF1080 domain-containing protein [Fulvivirga sp. M361]|uniref:3-keto-disaccharide hydrolase n=1 Tax=Fulvivirga sp. M361 TaxID=2594266 RepID=UPI001179A76B|nr:DUF1080 domain-containing protein [Fulvivirga sp. M361]TRX58198.1 DUF1080 domain-containing protein [Fulvivirga sp. M361]